MHPEEKGVFIDLLAHQHQKGNLPCETNRLARITGLSLEQFEKIWSGISPKFVTITTPDGDRMVNQKLTRVVSDRKEDAKKKQIAGMFGTLCRTSKLARPVITEIKKSFKVDDFMAIPDQELTTCITTWFNGWSPFLANAIEDANANSSLPESVHTFPSEKRNPENRFSTPRFALMGETKFLEEMKLKHKASSEDIDYRLEQFSFKRIKESTLYTNIDQVKADFQYFLNSWDQNPANHKRNGSVANTPPSITEIYGES